MSGTKLEYGFWTLLNFAVRRVMGPVWLMGGGVATLSSVATLFDLPSPISIDGVPSSDISTKVLGVVISLFAAVTGWMFLRAAKYYPANVEEK